MQREPQVVEREEGPRAAHAYVGDGTAGQRLVQTLSQGRLHACGRVFEKGEPWAHEEQPEKVSELLTAFLREGG